MPEPTPTVSRGLFRFCSETDLDTVRGYYRAAVLGHARSLASNGRLIISGRQGDESWEYDAPGGIVTLEQLGNELQNAYAELAGEAHPHADRATAGFR